MSRKKFKRKQKAERRFCETTQLTLGVSSGVHVGDIGIFKKCWPGRWF